MSQATDIVLKAVDFAYQDYRYRTPIKFGGVALDRVTVVDVRCDVETAAGKRARGFGSMPLGNVWSFPSRVLSYEDTLAAMKALVVRVAALFGGCTESGHPIELFHALEPSLRRLGDEATQQRGLAEPVPYLCTLVAASAFDAAVHDAYGKTHGLNCYQTYGPAFLAHDLGHYLGPEFTGERLDRYLYTWPQPRLPLYHLVGALDPLTDADVKTRIGDGLPETLREWIRYNGLTHLKVKLNGDDLGWDVARLLGVEAVARATPPRGLSASSTSSSRRPAT
jgi:hypothetical protein